MADVLDEQGEVNWKIVLDELSQGKVVEIPCVKEREFVRRTTQAVKRAEKLNMAVDVSRNEAGLRVEPRGDAPLTETAGISEERRQAREERQRERAQRREALRAERGADRGREP